MNQTYAAKLVNVANNLIMWINNIDFFIFFFLGASFFLCLTGFTLKTFNKPNAPLLSPLLRFFGKLLIGLGTIICVFGASPFISLYILGFLGSFMSAIWIHVSTMIISYTSGLTFGVIFALPLIFRYIPLWERGKGLFDVKDVIKNFSKFKKYNPLQFVDVKKGCFIGKDKNKPIYIPWRKLREAHVQVLGATGCGKGVAISLIAFQCTIESGTVIFIDPKHDRYSSRILRDAALKAGKPFIYLNLNPDQPPQLNILRGTNRYEIEELFVAGFNLRCRGTDGDFYRGRDEDAAILAAEIAERNNIETFSELRKACECIEEITDQENFWRYLRKIADLEVINTKSGIDIREAINESVVYIVGSVDNERIKMLQKMILVRIMQIIKKRDRFHDNYPVCIILDELKHLISFPAINALGTIRDFNGHFILAHQSLSDLKECSDVAPEAVFGAVVDNTAIKIIYRTTDADFAERISKSCGMKRTFSESVSKFNDNDTHDKLSNGWQEVQEYFISPDILSHLPIPSDHKDQASVGVLFGIGNAKIFHVGPVPTEGPMPQVVAAAPSSTSREELI